MSIWKALATMRWKTRWACWPINGGSHVAPVFAGDTVLLRDHRAGQVRLPAAPVGACGCG